MRAVLEAAMLFRCALLLLAFAVPAAAADKVTRETITSGGKTRDYFLYVPENLKPDIDAPLLVLLHGSGRDGRTVVDPWTKLAREEGIILVGPNSSDRAVWDMRKDSPYLIADLVDAVRSNHKVDLKRIYLFGHSAGAIHSLMLGLLESEYFAAVAVHAGVLPASSNVIAMAERKIPFGIWIGTNDSFFPLTAVEATRATLEQNGFSVLFRPMKNHTHNYYQRSDDVNKEAWAFLREHRLAQNPKFKEYDMK
jgi:poly(3-hydroxybutyrate) depolymerase